MEKYLDIQEEVRVALAERLAVVALESTVISHGLPYPVNVETAFAMEERIRSAGAVPATIGLLDGRIIVGLNSGQIERLAKEKKVAKVSRADFGPVLASKQAGATTVAATMLVSAAAGIRFFATGGIGGVHRGARDTFDVSADLSELSRSPVAVVCAGPKAILDIALTLEVLETLGVPVIGFGSAELPAFYSRDSGHTLAYSGRTAEEMQNMLRVHWELGLAAGVLITNPPPIDVALRREDVDQLIDEALAVSVQRGIRGKAVTPFLLSYLGEASQGKTQTVNVALLKNNATVAAEIAQAFFTTPFTGERGRG